MRPSGPGALLFFSCLIALLSSSAVMGLIKDSGDICGSWISSQKDDLACSSIGFENIIYKTDCRILEIPIPSDVACPSEFFNLLIIVGVS